MSFANFGVNTMRVSKTLLFGLFCFVGLMLAACGSREEPDIEVTVEGADTTAIAADTVERSDDWNEVAAVVDEVITRLRYGDKSGLYENEFEYLQDAESLDEYLRHGEITWANADGLDSVEITDITFFDRDSAWIDAVFHVHNADGISEGTEQRLMAYYHRGRWIKPYMSTIDRQLAYDEQVRQADRDAEDDSW